MPSELPTLKREVNAMPSPFLTQPYLLSLDPAHEMNIVWLQLTPSDGYVAFGDEEGRLDARVRASEYLIGGLRAPADRSGYAPALEDNPPLPVYQYIATITGLSPGQRVYYRCEAGEARTQVYDFRAAPGPGEGFRFALMSDLQGLEPCERTVRRIAGEGCDFILYAGDLNSLSWRADKWFDMMGHAHQTPEERARAFFPSMQQEGLRLMSHLPVFFCPGNHEVDDLRVGQDPAFAAEDKNWHSRIFTQLMRPLYPEGDKKRWYTARWGDMQIFSLSIVRWATWGAQTWPGWRLLDDISPDSPQIRWLEKALSASDAPYKWVIEHWHLLNRGEDTQTPLCQPVIAPDGEITYPIDHGTKTLMPLYEKYGVNAVSYGHSHVYERYLVNGIHYIEAAYLAVCYRAPYAPLHPSGAIPVVEDNSEPSYAIVTLKDGKMTCEGHRAESGEVFDTYVIARKDEA